MENYKTTTSGTSYNKETPQNIIDTIEKAIYRGERVAIKYKKGYEDFTGYTKDGINVTMLIGRSAGRIKVPLHLPNKKSKGGRELSTNLIESIRIL